MRLLLGKPSSCSDVRPRLRIYYMHPIYLSLCIVTIVLHVHVVRRRTTKSEEDTTSELGVKRGVRQAAVVRLALVVDQPADVRNQRYMWSLPARHSAGRPRAARTARSRGRRGKSATLQDRPARVAARRMRSGINNLVGLAGHTGALLARRSQPEGAS